MDITREEFFHFIWENLHFRGDELMTTKGDDVFIIHPGYHNNGDGPDYRYARIRIGKLILFGDVELHRKASEWIQHSHHLDSRYERVILHVVHRDDLNRCEVRASDGQQIPTLELRSALPSSLARLWRAYHHPIHLPCSGIIKEIPDELFDGITKGWDNHYFNYRLDRMVSLYDTALPMKRAWKKMLIRGVFQGLGYHKNQVPMLELANSLFDDENVFHDGKGFRHENVNHDEHTFHDEKAIPVHRTGTRRVKSRSGRNHASGGRIRKPAKIEIKEKAVIGLQKRLLHTAGLNKHGEQFDSSPRVRLHEKDPFQIKNCKPNRNDAYLNDTFILKRTDWDFSSSRPSNQPVLRICQAAELFLRINQLPVQYWLHYPVDSIWDHICRLQYTSPPGKHRHQTIFHNVLIPACYLLGRWLHHKGMCESVRKLWDDQHIAMPDRIKRQFIQSNFPSGNYKFRLATLHHFKYFCTTKRCGECEVMKYMARA